MKNIYKNLYLILALIGISINISAQNTLELTPYVEDSVDGIPIEAHQTLLNKMGEILTKNGVVKGSNSSMILTCNTTVSDEVITSTTPSLYVYDLQTTFYIGNGFDGTLYASYSTNLKGTGTTKIKAYIDAFKGIKTTDNGLHNFIETAKQKVVAYYNSKCSSIMAEVTALEKTNNYEGALYKLSSIPDASKCYTQAQQKIGVVYQKAIDNDCKIKVANASNIWAANPNEYGANEVSSILATINPSSTCFAQAKVLGAKVEKKMSEIDQREFKIRYEQEVGLEKDRIEAIKEIGKAYGNGQPKNVTYNTKYWW